MTNQDYEAVANFTGQFKMNGAQGPAPTISEMISSLDESIGRILIENGQEDIYDFGIESLISTLCLRAKLNNPVTHTS
jgi:hypothetical protein